MHFLASHQKFVQSSLDELTQHLNQNSDDVRKAIGSSIGSSDSAAIEKERVRLAAQFAQIHATANNEPSHGDVAFVSRCDLVGLYQSALSTVFSRVPSLQGYGNHNPIWVITLIEEGTYRMGSFFKEVAEDMHGKKEPILQAVLTAWKDLKSERAPYPPGTPSVIALPPNATIALLADWGGDNPAAKNIAQVAKNQKPNIAIHLGDIYYGGVKSECESFLRLWPFQTTPQNPETGVAAKTSYALNGNHEMYSGGESFFNIVLKAFGQPQPFFCLENTYWRIIGLDTAYGGGRLKPMSADDPLTTQWNWLVGLLRNSGTKKNILLTHHQPVSAHEAEFSDSEPLRQDYKDLLASEGIASDAIFGWFFGHEHRCAIYRDSETPFNARLIGNGCIPHEVQREIQADRDCTPVDFVNHRQDQVSSGAAVSMFAVLTFSETSSQLLIQYLDEDSERWGAEVWDATKGRLGGEKFVESDFDQKLIKTD